MDHKSKTSVRTLTVLALLTAMSIIFARVFTISTGFVRFNLGALPVLLAARIPNALVLSVINTLLMRLLLQNRALMRAVKKP